MAPRPRADCPVCGEERSLTKKGVIAAHSDPNSGRVRNPYTNPDYCEGSGMAPTTENPVPDEQPSALQPRLSPSKALLRYFTYDHLPPHLRPVSKACADLAYMMERELPDGAEKTFGLRQLLLAKDAFVRAGLK